MLKQCKFKYSICSKKNIFEKQIRNLILKKKILKIFKLNSYYFKLTIINNIMSSYNNDNII